MFRTLLAKWHMWRARVHFRYAQDLKDEASRHIQADNPDSAHVYLTRADGELNKHRKRVRSAYWLLKD